jgi:hypothetical protein
MEDEILSCGRSRQNKLPTNHRGRVFGGYVGIGEVVRHVFDRLLVEEVNVRVEVHGLQVEPILLSLVKIWAVLFERFVLTKRPSGSHHRAYFRGQIKSPTGLRTQDDPRMGAVGTVANLESDLNGISADILKQGVL